MQDAPRTKLVLVRHGQTDSNAAGRFQGQQDVPLNRIGRSQAATLAERLVRLKAARVVTSDLLRASATAEAIATASGIGVEVDAGLREIHVGQWQGRTHAHVIESYPALWSAISQGEDLARGEDGERVADVVRRARPVVDSVLRRLPAGALAVVVTHGVTARALVADLVGIDQSAVWTGFVGLRNCHWAMLVERPADPRDSGTGWRLDAWNAHADDPADGDLGSGAGSG